MRLSHLAMVCAFVLPALSAPPEAPQRVAAMQLREAIASTKEGRKRIAELKEMIAKRQEELSKEQAEIDAMKNRLADAGSLLNGGAKEDLTREIGLSSRRLQRHLEDVQWQARQEEARIYRDINERMLKVIADYARKNRFVLVMNASVPATSVLWASAVVNITGRIVQQYDLAYPVDIKPAPAPVSKTRPQ